MAATKDVMSQMTAISAVRRWSSARDIVRAYQMGSRSLTTNRQFCQVVILLAAALLVFALPGFVKADGGGDVFEARKSVKRALVMLPCEFEVPPQNRLYVYGRRIHEAVLTLAPGDSLRVNGIPIKPLRPGPPEGWPSEESCVKVYGDAPLFQELVQSGMSAQEAAREYARRVMALNWRIRHAYSEALEEGHGAPGALEYTLGMLRELDRDMLIDWDQQITSGKGYIELYWRGMLGSERLSLVVEAGRYVGPPTPEEQVREKLHFATTVYERMARWKGPCWYFITHGGTVMGCGSRNVQVIRDQLQHARDTGEAIEGPVPEDAVMRIIENEQAEGRNSGFSSQPSN